MYNHSPAQIGNIKLPDVMPGKLYPMFTFKELLRNIYEFCQQYFFIITCNTFYSQTCSINFIFVKESERYTDNFSKLCQYACLIQIRFFLIKGFWHCF